MRNKIYFKPGDKMWRLTVIKYLYTGHHRRRYLLFKCDCGNEVILQAGNVSSGNTKSCGCLVQENADKKRLPNNAGVINQIILQYKRHAKDRDIPFCLTFDEVSYLINQPCHYCGTTKSNLKITKHCKNGYAYNGIDRIDSKKSYTIDNVVPSCKTCNLSKMDKTYDDFLKWIEKIYIFSIKNKRLSNCSDTMKSLDIERQNMVK